MKIVAICGSLRAGSSNLALLRAAADEAPNGVEVTIFDSVGGLPLFSPDLDGDHVPPPVPVARFRTLLDGADGVLIASPEYAHGVPGALKNALDWVVSTSGVVDKPVALINAAPGGGEQVQACLTRTLTVMAARVLVEVSLLVPGARQMMDADGAIANPEVRRQLRAVLEGMAAAVPC
ncbi:MAG: NAD(P)H-dependent oxidoreductase [Nitrospirota bacterium]|nr:NAD(P)H-dependent oxidoreductase [Nitrospirota bacterium]